MCQASKQARKRDHLVGKPKKKTTTKLFFFQRISTNNCSKFEKMSPSSLLYLIVLIYINLLLIKADITNFCSQVSISSCQTILPRDMVFVLDKSASMDSSTLNANLLTFVQRLYCKFDTSTGSQAALISFGRDVKVDVSLAVYTTDAWANKIESIRGNLSTTNGNTPTAEGLFTAFREFTRNGIPGNVKKVLVITDGTPNPLDTAGNSSNIPSVWSYPYADTYYAFTLCISGGSLNCKVDYLKYLGTTIPAAVNQLKSYNTDIMMLAIPNRDFTVPDTTYFAGTPAFLAGCTSSTECTAQSISCDWCSLFDTSTQFNICKCTKLAGSVVSNATTGLFTVNTYDVNQMITVAQNGTCRIPPATYTPTRSPTTSTPTKNPTKSTPTKAPTVTKPTRNPTKSPTSAKPSTTPTTSKPSKTPTSSVPTRTPTDSPSTSKPTRNPTIPQPTKSPTKSSPTLSPTTSRPSKNPTTSKPSRSPTRSPTKSPSTSRPSKNPTTAKPSKNPTTSRPSKNPTSSKPTRTPTDSPTFTTPTKNPTTSTPSKNPTNSVPTKSPTKSAPTKSPTKSTPTASPVTSKPTLTPTTSKPTRVPTDSPSVSSPTKNPTTSKPSKNPTTSKPTKNPTTSRPSKNPTSAKPSASPISSKPTGAPSTTKPTGTPSSGVPTKSPSNFCGNFNINPCQTGLARDVIFIVDVSQGSSTTSLANIKQFLIDFACYYYTSGTSRMGLITLGSAVQVRINLSFRTLYQWQTAVNGITFSKSGFNMLTEGLETSLRELQALSSPRFPLVLYLTSSPVQAQFSASFSSNVPSAWAAPYASNYYGTLLCQDQLGGSSCQTNTNTYLTTKLRTAANNLKAFSDTSLEIILFPGSDGGYPLSAFFDGLPSTSRCSGGDCSGSTCDYCDIYNSGYEGGGQSCLCSDSGSSQIQTSEVINATSPGNVSSVLVNFQIQACRTGAPTLSPSTSAPSKTPTKSLPTRTPTTSKPTKNPTTSKPSKNPTSAKPTRSPTKSPTKSSPTKSPTKSSPTKSPTRPTTFTPSKSPSTSKPSRSPTRSPTSSPTKSPSSSKPSRSPTLSPIVK